MGARLDRLLLFTGDLPRALTFYRDALGLAVVTDDQPGFVVLRAASGAELALHAIPPDVAGAVASPPTWREDTSFKPCFAVDDLDAACHAVRAHGGQTRAPWAWAGTVYCECADVDGNVVQLFQRAGG